MKEYTENDYEYKCIKGKLEEELQDLTNALEKWKQVSFNLKKDGTPYKDMKKNFNNAYYETEINSIDEWKKCLYVNTETRKLLFYEQINCYDVFKNENDRPKDNRKIYFIDDSISKEYYYIYMNTFEEIKSKIKEKIISLKININRINKELKDSFEIYKNFKEKYNKLLCDINKDFEYSDSTLYYLSCFATNY